jgi:hypothetical protein
MHECITAETVLGVEYGNLKKYMLTDEHHNVVMATLLNRLCVILLMQSYIVS